MYSSVLRCAEAWLSGRIYIILIFHFFQKFWAWTVNLWRHWGIFSDAILKVFPAEIANTILKSLYSSKSYESLKRVYIFLFRFKRVSFSSRFLLCSPRKTGGFVLSVRLKGVVEGPLICFSHVHQMMQVVNGEHCGWCLTSKYHFILGLDCRFCPDGKAALISCRLILLCCMGHAIKGHNSSKESLHFWSFIKNEQISKKAYMEVEARTAALPSTSTYKGVSFLNWVTVYFW